MPFVSGVADSVGAYTLSRVTGPVAGESGGARSRRCLAQPYLASCSSLQILLVLSGLVRALPLPKECVVSTSVMDQKQQQGPLQFGTSDVAGVARMRLITTTNCLRDSNSGFFLEVYSLSPFQRRVTARQH